MQNTLKGEIARTNGVAIEVGLDEAVAVFVNKYEEALYERRAVLIDGINKFRDAIENLDENIESSVDLSSYAIEWPMLGVTAEATNATVVWDGADSYIRITVMFTDEDETNSHTKNFGKYVKKDISEWDLAEHNSLENNLANVVDELVEVDEEIANISRKERQVRAKISEIRLRDFGYGDLLNNDELKRLVKFEE
jgi:hypothetical protein